MKVDFSVCGNGFESGELVAESNMKGRGGNDGMTDPEEEQEGSWGQGR